MNNTQKIGVGVVILGVLGYGVYVQSKKDQNLGTAKKDTASGDLPEMKGTEDVDKITITNADKGEVTLEKKGDKWMVTKPVNAPANQQNVKQLVDNLKEVKATELVEAQPTDEVAKTYQLDPAHAVHVVAFKGADKKVDDWFGKSGGRGQMAKVGDKPGIYATSGYSSYLYTREVKNWRDTEIFKFDDANATSVTIAKKDGELSFTKGDKWAASWKGKPLERFDEDKLKAALASFKGLNADDFGDGKTPAETGLDAPESTVTIGLKDNAGKYVLHVGKTATGTTHYAQKDGDSTIYVIPALVSDYALDIPTKFQRPLDAGAPKDGGGSTAAAEGMPGMPPGMQGMPGMPPGHPGMPH